MMTLLKITLFISLKITLHGFQAQKMKDMNLLLHWNRLDNGSAVVQVYVQACVQAFFLFFVHSVYNFFFEAGHMANQLGHLGGFLGSVGSIIAGCLRKAVGSINHIWKKPVFYKLTIMNSHINSHAIFEPDFPKRIVLWFYWYLIHQNRLKIDKVMKYLVKDIFK